MSSTETYIETILNVLPEISTGKEFEELKESTELKNLFSHLLKGEGENIFLVSHILTDGIGDAVLFARLAQKFTEFPIISGYNVFYLVTCHKNQEKEVHEKLLEYGLEKTHLVCYVDGESPSAALIEYLKGESVKQQELKLAISKPHAFYNFSSREMERSILPSIGFSKSGLTATKPGEVPIASIAELGGASFKRNNTYNTDGSFVLRDQDIEDLSYANGPLMRVLGSATRHHGLLLTPPPLEVSKAKSLSSIQDKVFLAAMLGKKITSFEEKQASEFLNHRLLVPAYFQEGPEVFASIVYSLAHYSSKQNCKEVVISVNKGNFDNSKFKMSLLRKYNISEIAYVTPEKRQKMIIMKEASDKSIKIKILEGFHLNAADYLALVKSATLCGCSGDNSFDMAISHGIFPINQVRSHKRDFWNAFIVSLTCLAPELDFSPLSSMSRLNAKEFSLHHPDLQQKSLESQFDAKLIAAWPNLMKRFQSQYNFFDIYPSIIAQVLCQARINQLCKTTPEDARIPILKELEKNLDIEINARERKPHEAIVNRLRQKTERPAAIQKLEKETADQSQTLELRSKFFDPNSLAYIFKALAENNTIQKLFFSENPGDAKEVWQYFLEALSKNNTIRGLDLANNEITPLMLGTLVDVLIKKPNIRSLNLSSNFYGRDHAPHIKRLLQGMPNLEHLDLSFTDLDDEVISIFAKGLLQSKLQYLVLDLNPKITIQSIPIFYSIKGQNPAIGNIVLNPALLKQAQIVEKMARMQGPKPKPKFS